MRSEAALIPRNAPSTALVTGATKVMTDRLWDASDETSRTDTPSADAIASRMAATTSKRRPSEKFGTHSISFIRDSQSCPPASESALATRASPDFRRRTLRRSAQEDFRRDR